MAATQTFFEKQQVMMKLTNTDTIVMTLGTQLLNELEFRTDTIKEAAVTELKCRLTKVIPRKHRFFKNALDVKDIWKALVKNHECILKALECFCINFIPIHPQSSNTIKIYCEHIKTVVNGEENVTSNKGDVLSTITHMSNMTEVEYQFSCQSGRNCQARNESFLIYVPTNGQDIDSMIDAGFYVTGDGNEIQCIHCDKSISTRKPGDNPLTIHGPGNVACPNLKTENKQESITGGAAVLSRPPAKRKIKMDNSRMKQPLVTKYIARVKRVRRTVVKPKQFKQSVSFLRKKKWTQRSSTKGTIPIFETKHAKQDNDMEHKSQTSECNSGSDRNSNLSSPVSSSKANEYPMSNVMAVDDKQAAAEMRENVSGVIFNPRYQEEVARRETYRNWPSVLSINPLVKAGFFYTGDEDIVRCFYCDISIAGWDREDDPWREHARHSADCTFLKEKKGKKYIVDVQVQWSKIYSPKYPQLNEMSARMETFDSSWPQQDVMQSPEQLVRAGFFYTGEGDFVRCHYCDGGLREWEPTDDPWVEHAHYFPFCKFLMKIKGIDFIQRVIDNANSEEDDFGDDLLSSPAKEIRLVLGQSPDFWEDRTREDLMGIGDINNSSGALNNIVDGDDGKADISMMHQVQRHDLILQMAKDSTDTEMAVLMNNQDAGDKDSEKLQNEMVEIKESDKKQSHDFSLDTLLHENEHLKERSRCKICFEDEVYSVFLPCGHIVACRQCGEKVTQCPNCNKTVNRRLKVRL